VIPESLRSMLLACETRSGAFASFAHLPDGPVADDNAFATVLVLDLLAGVDHDAEISRLRRRAAGFLLRCRRTSGGFGFYPADAHPGWIRESLPADADDTALVAVALFRAGVWRRDDLEREVRVTLGRYRLQRQPHGAPWFRAGVYPTWLDAARIRNPIDVCVNLNVAVLIQESGVGPDHGCGEILDMVDAALDWAGASTELARAITPYYPHPAELGHALGRAVKAGVSGADGLLARYLAQAWSRREDAASAPICSSAGAGVVWTSPVLQAVRRWAHEVETTPVHGPRAR
jgi:hypothetical protein